MRFALPGTNEPQLKNLNPAELDSLHKFMDSIIQTRIEQMVRALPGPRNRLSHPEAMQAADAIISKSFTEASWQVEMRPYVLIDQEGMLGQGEGGATHYERLEGINIVATLPGESKDLVVVVMAHSDTVSVSPGANDNTASVACLLEMARVLATEHLRHTVVFVAPDMEEIGYLGSQVFAAEILKQYQCKAVINFETMAYVSEEPGSQRFVAGFEYLYPHQVQRLRDAQMRGNTTVILYNGAAIPLTINFVSALAHLIGNEKVMMLRDPNNLPLIGNLLGRRIQLVRQFGRSDHIHFWKAGLPAIMVTDTANFRYSHYHKVTDTPDRLDYTRLAQIACAGSYSVAHAQDY